MVSGQQEQLQKQLPATNTTTVETEFVHSEGMLKASKRHKKVIGKKQKSQGPPLPNKDQYFLLSGQKRKANLQIRKIFTYLDKEKHFPQQTMHNVSCRQQVSQNLYSLEPSEFHGHTQSGRKKLLPLKKSCNARGKKTDDYHKDMKITFLSIQKIRLMKMYSDPPKGFGESSEYESESSHSLALDLTVAKETLHDRSLLKKPPRQKQIRTFKESNPLSKTSILFAKNKSKIEKKTDFKVPFDKYYYRDFIWKVAFSNEIRLECPQEGRAKMKVLVGMGNNSLLIKSLMKRRSQWWVFTENQQEANFLWTQIKSKEYFSLQQVHSKYSLEGRSCISGKHEGKFMNNQDLYLWNQYFLRHHKIEEHLDETMAKRNRFLQKFSLRIVEPGEVRIHNHLSNNYVIGNKKALFYTMSKYYELQGENAFDYLPLTYHIQHGLEDSQYLAFLNEYYSRAKKGRIGQKEMGNIWIVKPGEFTNRGNGIKVCLSLQQIKQILKIDERHGNGSRKTYIIQTYLERPLLYEGRKFDLRHYMMLTSVNGRIKGYWYERGYVRTTSCHYDLRNNSSSIHLTNDSVQKHLPQYGKYEKGNKLSYEELHKYLERVYRYSFFGKLYPAIKKIATDVIKASALSIESKRRGCNFEVFGMDFMIGHDFRPWLIEVNSNPCLQLSCPLLASIIPQLIENVLRICVDTLAPPPASFTQKRAHFNDKAIESNHFELVYDSAYEEFELSRLFSINPEFKLNGEQFQKDEEEEFEDDGKQLQD